MPRCSWLLLLVLGCGQDENVSKAEADAGAGTSTASSDNTSEFPVAESELAKALRDARTRKAVCTGVGIVASAQAGGPDCQTVARTCEVATAIWANGVLGDPDNTVSNDLMPVLGCPITFAELDACLGDLAVNTGQSLEDWSCTAPSDEQIQPQEILASAPCVLLLVKCPQLFGALLQGVR